MPITTSATKALRKSERRRVLNVQRKKALKEVIKKYRKIAGGNKNEAMKTLPQIYKALDKAAKIKLIKPNKASRLKSRLTHLVAEK